MLARRVRFPSGPLCSYYRKAIMSEIVYTERHEQGRSAVAGMEYGRAVLDNKVTIFKSRDKVSLVTSRLIVGVPRGEAHKNKRYYYWRAVESYGFRRNNSGNVIPFQCRRPFDAKVGVHWQHQLARQPFMMLDERDDWAVANEYRAAVRSTFGVEKASDIYPMMDEYGLQTYWSIPNSLKAGFRQRSVDAMATAVFGKTRVNPRLIAAVQNTEPYIVALAQQFRGLVTDKKIIKFMENNHFDDEMEEGFTPHSPDIRIGLLGASQSLRDGLIQNTLDLSDMKRIQYLTGMGKYTMRHYFTGPIDKTATTYSQMIGR